MKQVAGATEVFMAAGLLERTQNPMHAARMYVLVLNAPLGGGLRELVDLASTRAGRRNILEVLEAGASRTPPMAVIRDTGRAIA